MDLPMGYWRFFETFDRLVPSRRIKYPPPLITGTNRLEGVHPHPSNCTTVRRCSWFPHLLRRYFLSM